MNKFDAGLGYYDGMGGIGSSLKKALKKVGKGIKTGLSSINEKRLDVRHAAKKITDKIKPDALKKIENKVREVGREADRKGITKLAAAAALSVVSMGGATPALAAAMAAAKGYAVKKLGESGAKDYATVKATEQQLRNEAQAAATLGEAVRSLPEFQSIIDGLRAEGYSDADIAAHWVESRAYYETALVAATDAVYPAVLQETVDAGVPAQWQQPIAEQASLDIANNAVKQVQSETTGKSLLPLLAIGAALLLGG